MKFDPLKMIDAIEEMMAAQSLHRSLHTASLFDEDLAGARGDVSPAQARSRGEAGEWTIPTSRSGASGSS